MKKTEIEKLLSRIDCSCLGTDISFRVDHDVKHPGGRIFIQAIYNAPCTKTGIHNTWKGRKWYLSSHMTKDEVIKTAFVAFKAAVEHEIMEGFKVDGIILFNPHVNFEALLEASKNEVGRELQTEAI